MCEQLLGAATKEQIGGIDKAAALLRLSGKCKLDFCFLGYRRPKTLENCVLILDNEEFSVRMRQDGWHNLCFFCSAQPAESGQAGRWIRLG